MQKKVVEEVTQKLNITTEAVTKRLTSLSTQYWLVVVFRVITPPDQTQLNSAGCRNSELVQTDETDKKLDDLS